MRWKDLVFTTDGTDSEPKNETSCRMIPIPDCMMKMLQNFKDLFFPEQKSPQSRERYSTVSRKY